MSTSANLLVTQVPGLDLVLGGGLTRNELVVLVGPPGAGKTVLASQILFHAARRGMRGLVFTSYSEGNAPYLEHMRPFAFFDETLFGGTIALFSLGSQRPSGEQTFASTLLRTIRQEQANVVLLDGFQALEGLLDGAQPTRVLLAALATQIRYLNATVLVTLAGDIHDPRLATELTIADAAIGLHYKAKGRKHTRRLEVTKRRGRAQLAGLHTYTIAADGVTVFPRLEAYATPAERPRPATRAPFNLPELDTLLGGGLTRQATTLLAGAPGTGKTTLALHWALVDARPDASTLFVAFGERPSELVQKAATFGLDLEAKLADGSVRIEWLSPVEPDPDVIAQRLRDAIAATSVTRLVIDDVAVLLRALGKRALDYLAALHLLLPSEGITSMFLLEIPPFQGFQMNLSSAPLGLLSENIILMQQYETGGVLRRLLAVLRMRFSSYDRTVREIVFEQGVVRVLRPEESEQGVLKAVADGLGGAAPIDERDTRVATEE